MAFWLSLFVMMAGSGISVAQSSSAAELVRTALAKYEARESQTKDYEYLERCTLTDFGDVHSEDRSRTWTYENMIVDGRQLRRELRDGKPMTREEEEQEFQELVDKGQQWADRQVTAPYIGSAIVINGGVPRLSLKKLPYLFDVRLVRTEMLDSRSTYVIDAKPKRGQHPSDEVEDDLRNFKLRIWIDRTDFEVMQIKAVAIHSGVIGNMRYVITNPRFGGRARQQEAERNLQSSAERFKEGTTVLMEWRKVNDEAWLPTRVRVKGSRLEPLLLTPLQRSQIVGDGSIEWPFEEDTVFYNYKKFGVTHRLLLPDAH